MDGAVKFYRVGEKLSMVLGVFRVLWFRVISCAEWENNEIAVLLSEQWSGIVAEPGREGRLCAVRVQICQTFR